MHQTGQVCPFGIERPRSTAGATVARALAVFTLAVASGASLAAAGGAGPFSRVIAPGGFEERCVRLQAGEAVVYCFTADGALDFNIHHHRGRDVFYPVRRPDVREAGPARFSAPAEDDYCLMWENRGSTPTRLEGRVDRAG